MKSRSPLLLLSALCVAVLLASVACGSTQSVQTGEADPAKTETANTGETSDQQHPDIVGAELEPTGETWSLAVTVSSPYDSPERYADGWRVLGPDGAVLGEHRLTHDHANEQPFTRTQRSLEVPDGVDEVSVEGHDTENGYGGETIIVAVDRA